MEEDVVGRLSPLAGCLEQDREARLHLALTEVFVERPRPQGALDRDLLRVEEVRREEPVAVRHRPESTTPRTPFERLFDPGSTIRSVGRRDQILSPRPDPSHPSGAPSRLRTCCYFGRSE